jgi:NADH dehydrogenase
MVVAVAGGTGFVGGAIVSELVARGHRVVVLSRRAAVPDSDGLVEARAVDVTRPETLEAGLSGAQALVISLAFRNSPIEAPRRGQTFERVDAAGTEALVAAARGAGIRRLVYMSGAGAAPDAPRHWFRAKWRAEEAIRGSGIAYTIFRPSWIYGPGDHSLNRFLGFARRLPFVPQIGNGRQKLVPLFVADMAALAADALATPGAENATFEVGGPQELTMDEIVRTALRVSGRRRPILHAPARLMKLLVRPLTLLPTPPLTPDAIDFMLASSAVDTALLSERLPRRLKTLEEGLATYLASPR